MTTTATPADADYERDFAAWALAQAAALRARRFDRLDLERLADEVEDLRKAERNALRSQVRRIIEHLLKLQHSPAIDPRRGWQDGVRSARADAGDTLSPTLRREIEADFDKLYTQARAIAAAGLRAHGEDAAADALPEDCTYKLDDILGDWWP